jgi:hypothetical protein
MGCLLRELARVLSIGVLTLLATSMLFLREAACEESWYSLRDLESEIIQAISDARALAGQPPHFIVKKVELKLQGSKLTEAQGGFSIPVFGASVDLGLAGTTSASEVLELALVPSESIVVGGNRPEINLAELIAEVKKAFVSEKETKPLFIIETLKYEISWALQQTGEGGINLVIANAGLAISDEKRQQISFTLCETHNLRDCAK